MRRRRINRDFTKPEAIQPLIFFPSSFEQLVKCNKDHKYVPTGLLEAFGFHVNTEP